MNRERADAYLRVSATIDAEAPASLNADEVARIRAAADALFFAEEGATEAAEDIRSLCRHLASGDRWSEERAQQLLDNVLQCGELAVAA